MDADTWKTFFHSGKGVANGVFHYGEGVVKGLSGWKNTFGQNYKIVFPSKTSTVVSVVDKTLKSPVVRLDGPHNNVNFPHININPRISGIKDPHVHLPPGSLQVGSGAAKLAQAVDSFNEIAAPLVVAFNVAQVCNAMLKDQQSGWTSRNTMEETARVAGGWAGGYTGSMVGATLGSAVLPGVGTIIGGIVGCIAGAMGGANATRNAVSSIADKVGYDVEQRTCNECGGNYNYRRYMDHMYQSKL